MYRLTREAQANVNEITEFIAEDNVDAAIRVLDALEHAFARIAANPEIGHNRALSPYCPGHRPGVYGTPAASSCCSNLRKSPSSVRSFDASAFNSSLATV